MQLHQLKPTHKSKNKKRVGRGGKRGTYSGRGQKGQKSRAGRRIRPALRDLLIRIPKLRGIKNKPLRPKPLVLNLQNLAKIGSEIISVQTLKNGGLVDKKYRGPVKILGDGEVKKPLILKGLSVSKSAKIKIEKAGGKIT